MRRTVARSTGIATPRGAPNPGGPWSSYIACFGVATRGRVVHQFGRAARAKPLGLVTHKRHTAIMAPKHPKRPRDPNQLGKLIVDLSTGDATEAAQPLRSPAIEFARSGGLKGGHARAATLSEERRREIARLAAEKRWGSRKGK